MLTLGADGVLFQETVEHGSGNSRADILPALNQSARDVTGAGDSFLVLASLALTVGADLSQAAYLASIAAKIQVGRVGNIPISADEIRANLHK
jgi:bifunctional ADP-heptose synthase (sugar kinase/adenylyltransferase)